MSEPEKPRRRRRFLRGLHIARFAVLSGFLMMGLAGFGLFALTVFIEKEPSFPSVVDQMAACMSENGFVEAFPVEIDLEFGGWSKSQRPAVDRAKAKFQFGDDNPMWGREDEDPANNPDGTAIWAASMADASVIAGHTGQVSGRMVAWSAGEIDLEATPAPDPDVDELAACESDLIREARERESSAEREGATKGQQATPK